MLNKQLRMKRNTQFNYTFSHGESFCKGCMLIVVNKKKYKNQKIGVVVSKKIGNSVTRNHTKRLIREAIQQHLQSIKPDLDLIFVAREGINEWNFSQINSCLEELLKKSNALL